MKESKIISYNKDDYFLIKDASFKKGQYIGRIKSITPQEVIMAIYIFPEDTKDGKKEHMSEYEVFYTKREIPYKFVGDEKQVKVVELEAYIQTKYVLLDKSCEDKLYFRRQTYDEKSNTFYPYLTKICYCQKYFNPDHLFKTCGCGQFFHPDCFLRNISNKCWNPNCNINCTYLFEKNQLLEKEKFINAMQTQEQQPNPAPQKSFEISEAFFQSSKKKKDKNMNTSNEIITLEEFADIKTPDISKKTKKDDKNDRNAKIDMILTSGKNSQVKIKPEPHVINLSSNKIKEEKFIFDTTVYPRKTNPTTIKLEAVSLEEIKRKTDSEREKARNLFFSKMMDGISLLQKTPKILDDFLKEKPELLNQITLIKNNDKNIIESHYKELANSLEKNLFERCDKKTNQTYLGFLREFHASTKNAINILYRLILGDISPEEMSKFTSDDFLPEEKRKQKEELIRKTVQNMQFKEPMIIRATQVKGRMLSEIQDNIEINKPNYIMDMMLNLTTESTSSEYYQKIKKMKEEYPSFSDNDIKFLVEAKDPSIDEIENKLNSLIHKTLNEEEQKVLFEFRKNQLMKKAERYFKKKKDGKNGNNINSKNGTNTLLGKKFLNSQDYIKHISLDIKPY